MGWVSSSRVRVVLILCCVALLPLLLAGPAAANITAPGGLWYWQNPTPQGNTIAGMWFADLNTGWAVGSAGTIEKTADGGATWTPQSSPVREWLYDVAFADSLTGWAVGENGTIIKTTDGGTVWTQQTSTVVGGLNKLYVLDDQNVYVAGEAGVILHTVDGGATPWTIQPTPTLQDLNGITFKSLNFGWAVGAGGRVLRTNNGGLSWFFGSQGTADLNDVVFASLYEGWAVGNGGLIRHTIDGGATWAAADIGGDDLERIALASSGAWVTGTGGELAMSTDSGASWDGVGTNTNRDLWALAVNGSDVRLAGAGGFFTRAVDGATFTPMWATAANQTITDLGFADASNGWAVGANGTILRTADKGANWFRQESGVAVQLNDASAVASIVPGLPPSAWVVGNRPGGAGTQGTVLYSTDGGLVWQLQTVGPPNLSLNGVDFVSLTTGWAVGNNNALVTTGTGGAAWAPQTSGGPAGADLTGVDFTSTTNGCASLANGGNGGVRYTVNGGTTAWLGGTVPPGTPDLNDVDMVEASPLVGYAVGDTGTILKTIDAGVNWLGQTSNTTADLYGVTFAPDGLSGVAVGDAGTVVGTTDGGTTWTLEPWSFSNDLRGATSIDAATRWIGGGAGTILSNFDPNTLAVTNLKGDAGDTKITVTWTNPTVDFGGVMVYYSTLRCASSVYDTYGQELAYEGTGATLGRTGLENNKQYYFSVFVRNVAGTWSDAQTLVVVPIPTFKPTLTVKPATQVAGRAIKFSGKVAPAGVAAGNKIYIQRFTGSWKTFATAKVKSTGAYAVSKKLTRGSYRVRAYMPGVAGKALAGSSPTRYATWR